MDNCEICKGTKGGVDGNENIKNGVVMCDYCSAEELIMDKQREAFKNSFEKQFECKIIWTGNYWSDSGGYPEPEGNDAWWGWQAATKQAEQDLLNIESIDRRLSERGMITLTSLLEAVPSPFILHAGVVDFDTFCQWVELRYKEAMVLKALMLAQKGEGIIEDDDLYGWSCAMANAYEEMYQHWKVVESNAKSQIESLRTEIKQLRSPWISVDSYLPTHSKDVRLWVEFEHYDSCEMIGFKQVTERAGRNPREELTIPQCDTDKHIASQTHKILFWAEQSLPPTV